MIQTFYGDALAHPNGLIVHGCNCQGVMGSGIALSVKKQFPQVFKAYAQRHLESPWQLGEIQVVNVAPDKYIVNAMTQKYYGRGGCRYVDYDAIKTCFKKVNDVATECGLDVVFPKIGAGLAGGNWEIIAEIIDSTVTVQKILYEY